MNPLLRRALTAVGAALLLAAMLVVPASAQPVRPGSATTVLEIYQNPGRITPQDAMTVGMQVSDASNIQQVYYTFCQLTSSLCYLPVAMTLESGNWYVGTTHPMTSYPGMDPGVTAGYNITIVFNDNSTQTEPSIPNSFANLTVAQSVTGQYEYEMTVQNPAYGVSGSITDAQTGQPVAGATVTLTPGTNLSATTDATGAYALPEVENGSYTLSVSKSGYRTLTSPITIAGHAVSKDVTLASNSSAAGSAPSTNFLTTPVGIAVLVGPIAVVALIGAIVARSMARRRRARDLSAGPKSP